MDKNEIAAAITANWAITEASTILQSDVKEFGDSAPQLGMLKEKAGRKIYAFLDGGVIKKRVIPICSGKPLADGRVLLSKIEENFTLNDLHRARRI